MAETLEKTEIMREKAERAAALLKKSEYFSSPSIPNPQKVQITKESLMKPRFSNPHFLIFPLLAMHPSFNRIFMKTDMTDELGLLAETDKPTKAPWFLRFAGDILRKNGSVRTTGGADQDGLWTQTAKGIVSFLQNLLPSTTPKEGVRGVPKSLPPWYHLPNRRHRHDLRTALRRPPTPAVPNASTQRRRPARRRHIRSPSRSMDNNDC